MVGIDKTSDLCSYLVENGARKTSSSRNETLGFYSFRIKTEKNLTELAEDVDSFYKKEDFERNPLGSNLRESCGSLNYRHLVGSEAHLLVTKDRTDYNFFLVFSESMKQREIRATINLLKRI